MKISLTEQQPTNEPVRRTSSVIDPRNSTVIIEGAYDPVLFDGKLNQSLRVKEIDDGFEVFYFPSHRPHIRVEFKNGEIRKIVEVD